MPGVLDCITVLDLSNEIAGPYASMLMSCMGARVIKVEPPGGSPERTDPRFYLWNRGKESLTLDLQSTEGQHTIRKIANNMDILIHNWRPSNTIALGLDYSSLKLTNPRLIYCAIPPYSEVSPQAEDPGDHYSVSADMGVFGDQTSAEGPGFVYQPLVAYGTAFTLCLAVSAALYVREAEGVGQRVEVSLQQGALAMQSAGFISGPSLQGGRGTSLRQGIRVGIPIYRLYRAMDGWFFLACGNNTFFNKLCILIQRPELVEDQRFRDAPWGIPSEHYDALSDILEPIFERNTVSYWVELLRENDIPCAPVQRREQYIEHPQVAVNEMMVTVDDPTLGPTIQMGVPIWMHGAPGFIPDPAPFPGSHTTQIIDEFIL